jgi:hypothetical protein
LHFIALVRIFHKIWYLSCIACALQQEHSPTQRTSAIEPHIHRTSIFGSLRRLTSTSGGLWHHQMVTPIRHSTSLYSFYGPALVGSYFVRRANGMPPDNETTGASRRRSKLPRSSGSGLNSTTQRHPVPLRGTRTLLRSP